MVTVCIATGVGVFRRGNRKLIVVKPARRKGNIPCNVEVSPVKGPSGGAWGERERA